jgi:drug/metabolite transporter (DMT)-like permease
LTRCGTNSHRQKKEPTINPIALGVAAALGSAIAWAAGSIVFKKISENVSPFGMTLTKGVASVCLLGLALCVTGVQAVGWTPLALLVLSGVIGIAIGDTLFFAALGRLGPFVLIVFFMLGQGLTAVLAIVFLRQVPPPLTWVGMVATLAGIAMVMVARFRQDKENWSAAKRGLVLGGLCMACMSSSWIIAEPALHSVPTLLATFIRMAAGTAGILLFGAATGRVGEWMSPVRSRRVAVLFLVGVSVVTFGGFWLSLVAIKYIEVPVASALGATEVLFVLPLAAIFLKERIRLVEIVGALVAAGGVFVICRGY